MNQDIRLFDLIYSVALLALLVLMAYRSDVAFLYIILMLTMPVIHKPHVIFPLYYVSTLSSSTSLFAVADGVTASRIFSIVLMLSMLIYLFNSKKSPFSAKNTLYVFSLILYLLFSCLISVSGSFDPFFGMLQNLLVLYFLQQLKGVNLSQLGISLVLGCVILTLFVVYSAYKGDAFSFEKRFTDEGEMNANRIAMLLCQTTSILLAASIVIKNFWVRIMLWAVSIASILVIIATGSRTALASVVLTPVVLIFFIQRKHFGKLLIGFVVIGIIAYFTYNFVLENTAFGARYDVEALQDSARFPSQKIIITKLIPQYFIFGCGPGGVNTMAAGKPYGLQFPAHNFFIDPFCQLGIVGFLLFMIFIFGIFKKCFDLPESYYKSVLLLFMAPAICAIFNGLGEMIFYEKFFWCDLAMLLMYFNSTNKPEQQEARSYDMQLMSK